MAYFKIKTQFSNHQTIHIYANMSCSLLLMMNNEYFVLFMVFKSVVLKLFQEEAPLRRVNSFVAPPKENSWRKFYNYNFTYKF